MAFATFLFGLTPRLYCTRIVIFTSLVTLILSYFEFAPSIKASPDAVDIIGLVIFLVFFVVVPMHHLASLLGPFKFFSGRLDFILLMIEIAGVTLNLVDIINGLEDDLGGFEVDMWTFLFCIGVTLGGLISLAIFRLATIIKSRGKAMTKPFNIQHFLDEPRPPFFYMLMGEISRNASYINEPKLIAVARCFLVLVFLMTMTSWIISRVIFEPKKDMNLGPEVREFHTPDVPDYFEADLKSNSSTWNIVISGCSGGTNLTDLVYFQTFEGPQCICTMSNACVMLIACPHMHRDPFLTFKTMTITANFSRFSDFQNENDPATSLAVSIVMTNKTDAFNYMLAVTTPIFMDPGTSTVVSTVKSIRQVFIGGGIASLGLFQHMGTFWEARIVSMYPDPLIDYRGTSNSSLRIVPRSVSTDVDIRILQDYMQSSVITGFSAIGGLWTVLDGIFAVIFGASMMHFMKGSKPLTIFGLAHSFRGQKVKDETLKLYPKIIEEHKDKENHGLLALIRDNLIDLSFLEKEYIQESKSTGDEEKLPAYVGNTEAHPLVARSSNSGRGGEDE